MTIQNILFPVDFSPSCAAMGAFVKKGAELFSARVTLLHVTEHCLVAGRVCNVMGTFAENPSRGVSTTATSSSRG